jgi:CRP-like cAMP-binding protein
MSDGFEPSPMLLDTAPQPRPNRLLAKLPARDRERFVDRCEAVDLTADEVIAAAGKDLRHAYFPTGCVVSHLTPGEGMPLEVALVGDEGMVGSSLAFGVRVTPVTALVQGTGSALRMTGDEFVAALGRSAALRKVVGAYNFVQTSQIARTASCNRFHVVEQRLARWLLMMADRVHASHFEATHRFLSIMLGVRRAGVTLAAAELQSRNLIRYTRGHMRILDRQGLEQASCDCYRFTVSVYDQVLG